jgi:hypothetical protein
LLFAAFSSADIAGDAVGVTPVFSCTCEWGFAFVFAGDFWAEGALLTVSVVTGLAILVLSSAAMATPEAAANATRVTATKMAFRFMVISD